MLESLDPSTLALERRTAGVVPPRVELICVYRQRNSKTVSRLITALGPQLESAHLWALDEPAAPLLDVTIGSGPGQRLELLNRLERESAHNAAGRTLIVADDDVILGPRRMMRFLRTARLAGLDVAQPAHGARSKASWDFNRRHVGTLMRRTSFVEAGPLVLFSEKGRAACFPLQETLGMGWGVEIAWAEARRGGIELGIIDAAPMVHVGPVARHYDRPEQEAQARAELRARGLAGFSDLQVVHDSWRLGAARGRVAVRS